MADWYSLSTARRNRYHEPHDDSPGRRHLHFQTELVGPWRSISIIYDADVAEAYEEIANLDAHESINSEDAAMASTTLKSTLQGQQRIRRSEHARYEAFVLIKTKKRRDEELFGELDNVQGYAGSAMTRGAYDIVLLIGGTSEEQLDNRLDAVEATINGKGKAEICYQPPLD